MAVKRSSSRSSSQRRSTKVRSSKSTLKEATNKAVKATKAGLKAAKKANEAIIRRLSSISSTRDGGENYTALRKGSLFFALSFWTYFGMASALCHMYDECRPLEKTVQAIEGLNILIYGLLFVTLTFGTFVFMLSALDLVYRSALDAMETRRDSVLKNAHLMARRSRISAGFDPEFMSGTSMLRPVYRVPPVRLPVAPLPPPAKQAGPGMVTYMTPASYIRRSAGETRPYRNTGVSGRVGGGGVVRTVRKRRSSVASGSRTVKRRSVGTVRRSSTRAPIARRSVSTVRRSTTTRSSTVSRRR